MIRFDCGCSFETNKDGFPIFNPNIEALPLDCPITWNLICDGNTKGVFQLESNLGQAKSKQVKPRSIEELSDLIAIIRPGCGDSIMDGKSLTQHYIDRKSGVDEVKYFHPDLEPILKNTFGILVYQEQAMQIAQLVAGFTLQQADTLRKAIGKKKVDLMAKVKKEFLECAKTTGKFSENDTQEIFGWIEKSQKYSFNKSHSISYAFNGYQTAYAKAHFPKEFFTSYLKHAIGKPKPFEEINELVNNAKTMGIEVMPPSILNMNANFKIIKENPTFGLTNIKKVGYSVYEQLQSIITNNQIDIRKMTWETFLLKLGKYIKSDSFESMIKAGAFDCYRKQRNEMLYQFNIYKELKDSDRTYLSNIEVNNLIDGLKKLIEHINSKKQTVHTKKHIDLIDGSIRALQSPAYELIDKPSWKAQQERELLGIEVTCSEIDEYVADGANCTCIEYLQGFNTESIAIVAQVKDIKEYKIKKGNNKGTSMCFLKIADNTCVLDNVTMFTEEWQTNKEKIDKGKVFLFRGYRDKNRGSFIIKRIQKLVQCI